MMIKKLITCAFIASVSVSVLLAQKKPVEKPLTKDEVTELKKQAGDLFKSKSYQGAMDIYKRLVVVESQNTEINYRLGYSILNCNSDRTKAVDYLEFAARQKDAPKDALYWLGIANLNAGAYDAAVKSLEDFKSANKGKPDEKYMIDQSLEWCYNARVLSGTPVEVSFSNLGKFINSTYDDYRPVVSVDDSIIFYTSNRKGTTGNQADEMGQYFSDVFFFTQNDSGRGKSKNMGMSVNSEFYEEALSITAAEDELYIYKESPEFSGDIFKSDLKGKSFQKAVALVGEDFKTKEYEFSAAVSPDGQTLIISSDKKNKDKSEKGGRDLYVCYRNQNGTWGSPENMGATINTAFDEDFPMFFADGKTLFFASQGHNSMGGYDIFMTTRPDQSSSWSTPVNIGYPLNTADDNKYFVLNPDGKSGYISGFRDSCMGGSDLYRFTLTKPLIETSLCVVKASVFLAATNSPAKNSRITITKKGTGTNMGEFFSNATTGSFITVLPPGEYDVAIRTEKAGKFDETLTVPENTGKFNYVFSLKQ